MELKNILKISKLSKGTTIISARCSATWKNPIIGTVIMYPRRATSGSPRPWWMTWSRSAERLPKGRRCSDRLPWDGERKHGTAAGLGARVPDRQSGDCPDDIHHVL